MIFLPKSAWYLFLRKCNLPWNCVNHHNPTLSVKVFKSVYFCVKRTHLTFCSLNITVFLSCVIGSVFSSSFGELAAKATPAKVPTAKRPGWKDIFCLHPWLCSLCNSLPESAWDLLFLQNCSFAWNRKNHDNPTFRVKVCKTVYFCVKRTRRAFWSLSTTSYH